MTIPKERNPYRWYTVHHWCWKVKQPSNDCHRLFWGVGMERNLPFYSIYWCGIITLWWTEGIGWEWSWNFD